MIELKKLSLMDGRDILEMIREIGPGENGFQNNNYAMSCEEFPEYLKNNIKISKGIDLNPEYVPQTIYWLYIDDVPVGMGKLRSRLNDNLRKLGGHIGYTIRPTQRGNGYGNLILKEMLKKAKEINISEVLITCNDDNVASRKVIEANNGVLKDINEGHCKYWIKTF